jgi:hypothetical protein
MKFILCFICVSLCLAPLAQIKVQKTSDKASHHITPKTERLCAGDGIKTHLMGLYPFLAEKERAMNNTIRFADANRRNREEDQYISVVVHVVHNFGEENISDEMVAQGMQHLNDAFANTGAYASADGADTHIRFCLAQQDPAGMPTNGINRVVSNLTYVVMENDDLNLKNTIRWDPERYLNIWLVGEIYSVSMGSAVAGYATLPYAHGLLEDGIVNEARWFGANADYSKVHIHEVGHYLGLYHTFEAGCSNGDCTMEGDLVCDTPPDQSTNALLCSDTENSCDSDDDDNSENNPFRSTALGGLGDQFDLIENYMDYGSQSCQTHFSAGQIERMQVALNEQRASLLESNGCVNSCGIGPVQIVSESEEILGGQPAFFFNQNTATNIPVNYAWQLNGEVIGTAPELTYIFPVNLVGNAWLTLTISGLNGECPQQDSLLLTIGCNPPAAFTMSPNYADVDEEITFVATSPGATQFQWYVDGVLTAAGPTYQTTFSTGGFHQIYLVTGNGICMDTSEMDYFGIGACSGRADNNWIFGSAFGVRLDFSSGVPEVTAVPQGPDPNVFGLASIEGMATISDQNGDLLFYSDGLNIYNRLYEPFYQNLDAGFSSSQGVQIVPDPGNANRYYVFTAADFADFFGETYGLGFAYVIVDMTENNGLGGVVSDYIELLPVAHERQTAVKHCNGRDIWIICQDWLSGAFHSYLLTETGISPPVISVMPSQTSISFIGQMVASPQGNKIAVTSYSGMALFDFDNETGTFIDSYPLTNAANSAVGAYGLAFSPDGSKLYYCNSTPFDIYQVDLSSGNDLIISNSLQFVGVSNTPFQVGAIQAGPDGKLYIAQSSGVHLDVIHEPNIGGLGCAFETDAIALPMLGLFGLNNVLVGSTERSGPQITGLSEVCEFTTGLTYTANCGNNVWTLSGNASLTELSSTEVNVSFESAGIVYLMCTSTDLCYGTKTDTLLIHVGNPNVSLGNDTTICSSGSITLGIGAQPFSGYLWSTGFATPNITVENEGIYWVEVTGVGGCSSRDTIEVSEFDEPFDVAGDTALICFTGDDLYIVYAPDNGYEHFWYSPNGPPADYITTYLMSDYSPWQRPIYYRNENGCIASSTIHIMTRPELPDEFLGPDPVLCPGEIVLVEFDETACPECTYAWQDGSTTNPYTVYTEQGAYLNATRFDPVCSQYAFDGVHVIGINPEYIELPDTVVSCDLYPYLLQVYAALFDSISWQDGSTSPEYSITSPGTYWITATSACGVFSDTTIAVGPVLNSLNLPESIALCAHQLPYALPVDGNFYNYQWSNNNGGWVYEAGEIAVMATDFCIEVYDTITVSVSPSPEINIPEIIQSCSDTTVVLSLPNAPGQVNYWQGIMQNNLDVSETGFYTYTAQHPSGCAIQDSVQVVISNLYFNIPDSTLCPGSILEFSPETNAPLWFWNLEDDETITITDTGMYVVFYSDYYCWGFSNFHITLTDATEYNLTLPDSLSACSNELPITIEAVGDVAENYAWSNGDSTATALLYNQGWYVLNTAYACGEKSDSTYLTIASAPPSVLPPDTVLCSNAELVLWGPLGYYNSWSAGEQTDTVLISQPGLVVLNSLSEEGCIRTDSVEVFASDLFISMPETWMLCPGDTLDLIASTNGNSYFWNTGETSLSIVIDSPGSYQFTSSSNFCNETTTVEVSAWPDFSFSLGEDQIVTSATAIISAPEGFDAYNWNIAGQNESSITVSQNGTYALTVTDENGCTYQDEIRVFFNRPSNEPFIEVPDLFSPDNGLIAQYNNVSVYDVKIFDAAGRLVNYGNTFPLLWDGRYSASGAATGMYYYIINYADTSGKKHVKKGNSLLVD